MRTGNRVGIIIAGIGVLLLGLGFLAVYAIINSARVQVTPIVITEPVLVAARNLPLGHMIQEGDLVTMQLPIEYKPRGALGDAANIVGRILKEDLAEGEMVFEINLADPTNVQDDLAFILSEGHVLMAFPAEDRLSKTNLLGPGDLIDIYASLSIIVTPDDPETEEDETVVGLLTFDVMQSQPVTAVIVGVTVGGDPQQKNFLLALNPQDALIVKNLLDQGANFDLVLRNPTSEFVFRLDPVTLEYIKELYGLELVLP